MSELISTLRGIVLLDQETYERFRDSRDAMKRGVLILLVAFLIAGSLQFVFTLVDNLRPFTAERAAEFQSDFLEGFDIWRQFLPQDDEFNQQFMEQFLQNFEMGLNMGVEIDAINAPLPRPIARFFQSLGSWVSEPFAHLGSWLAYAIWVLLFSKLLGGNGGVDRFLGLTALYAVPNLLGFFSPIPYVGGLIALVGTIWGWAVYVRAVQVSQRFDVGKAILVTVLPILLLLVLAAVFAVLAVLGIVAAASGS